MADLQEFSADLEDMLEQFEVARHQHADINLERYLPQRDHPDYRRFLSELIRADMEFSWDEGEPCRLQRYRQRFPDELTDKALLAALAFEEYRLRLRNGENAAPEEYAVEYGIAIRDWPILSRHAPSTDSNGSDSLVWSDAELPASSATFDGFELVGELGNGAFATVYLARQPALANRFVALKVTTTPLDEPQRLAQLQHTNIVPIFSVHREGDLHGICMPFLGTATVADVLQGFDARDQLPESGTWFLSTLAARRASTLISFDLAKIDPMTRDKDRPHEGRAAELLGQMSYECAVIWLIANVADGLAHAHEHGVIHRDLKPANILLSDDGEPLILDFNLSASSLPQSSPESFVGGTLPYMSSEHIASLQTNESVDARADVFSLGVMLFELLTGKRPFPERKGPLDEVAMQMIEDRRDAPVSLRRNNPAISTDVESIVQRCLADDAGQRYQSARDLQTDLRRHLDNLPLLDAPNRSLIERLRKWTRRHPRLASGTSVMLVSLVVCAVLVAAFSIQARQWSRLRAQQAATQTDNRLADLQQALAAVWVDYGHVAETIAEATKVVEQEQLDSFATGQSRDDLRDLAENDLAALRDRAATVQFLLAAATSRQAGRAHEDSTRRSLLEESLRRNELAEATFSNDKPPKAVYLQRSRILNALEESEESQQVEEQSSSIPVRGIEDRVLLAHEHMLNSDFAEAAALLEQAESELGTNFSAWLLLGNALTRLARFDDADRAFTVCLAIDSYSSWALFHRGTVRFHLKRHSDALADLSRAIEIGSRCTSAYVNRALVHLQMNNIVAAERDLTRALEMGTTETRIYFIRSKVRKQLGDEAGSQNDFQEGLRRVPSDELSWIARGVAKLPDDPAAALVDFEAALRINPRSWQALQNMADTLGNQPTGLENAIVQLDRLIELQPKVPQWVASRGVFHARLAHDDDALRDAQAALKLRRDADTRYRVAGIHSLVSARSPEHAEVALRRLGEAAWMNPSLVRAYINRDSDLNPIKTSAGFVSLLERLDQLRPTP